jgi:hypothetical protein
VDEYVGDANRELVNSEYLSDNDSEYLQALREFVDVVGTFDAELDDTAGGREGCAWPT